MKPKTIGICAFVVAGAAATLGVQATLAAPAAMHPVLGARLSGMGEHGVVNVQSQATKGKLCWTFDLPTTTGVTGASIHAGTSNVVLVRLGKSYSRKGCVNASAMTLEPRIVPRQILGLRRHQRSSR